MAGGPEQLAAREPLPIDGGTIEFVRGDLGDERAEQILAFWRERAGFEGEDARERLPEVVCILLGDDGEIRGANSVVPRAIPLLGGAELWVYRSFLVPEAVDSWLDMAAAAFDALHDEYNPSPVDEAGVRAYPPDPARRPVGLCIPIADPEVMRRYDEAAWEHPFCVYAGWSEGMQIRVGYFHWASVTDDPQVDYRAGPLEGDYRIEPVDRASGEWRQGVRDLWISEGAMDADLAERRLDEVLLVASDADGNPTGVCTAFLRHNEQLRLTLWHYRVFVAESHRSSHIAGVLSQRADAHLEDLFTSGADTRAGGTLAEIENEFLKRYFPAGQWGLPPSTFIGVNERGDHVRVRYFPGAKAPPA
jgi:hypothetical protein